MNCLKVIRICVVTIFMLTLYPLLNTKITYDFKEHHQIFVAVDNLLNENYQELYLSPAPGITGWIGYRYSL